MKDIGPDDGGHATKGGIEGGDQSHEQNAGVEGKSGGGGKGKSGGVDNGAEPAETAEDKEGGDTSLRREAKALLDELV